MKVEGVRKTVDRVDGSLTLGGMMWLRKQGVTGDGNVVFASNVFEDSPTVYLPRKQWLNMGGPELLGISYGTHEYFEVRSRSES